MIDEHSQKCNSYGTNVLIHFRLPSSGLLGRRKTFFFFQISNWHNQGVHCLHIRSGNKGKDIETVQMESLSFSEKQNSKYSKG